MSIKAFHIFFIVLSILTAAGVAVWSVGADTALPETATVAMTILSIGAGISLIWYCVAVVRKFRSIH